MRAVLTWGPRDDQVSGFPFEQQGDADFAFRWEVGERASSEAYLENDRIDFSAGQREFIVACRAKLARVTCPGCPCIEQGSLDPCCWCHEPAEDHR